MAWLEGAIVSIRDAVMRDEFLRLGSESDNVGFEDNAVLQLNVNILEDINEFMGILNRRDVKEIELHKVGLRCSVIGGLIKLPSGRRY